MASTTKISLFEMAEAVGAIAFARRGDVERWDRDHTNDPLPPTHTWVIDARRFETAHLTLSLMALDEEASRKFVSALMKHPDAKMLMHMHLPPPTAKVEEAEAA